MINNVSYLFTRIIFEDFSKPKRFVREVIDTYLERRIKLLDDIHSTI